MASLGFCISHPFLSLSFSFSLFPPSLLSLPAFLSLYLLQSLPPLPPLLSSLPICCNPLHKGLPEAKAGGCQTRETANDYTGLWTEDEGMALQKVDWTPLVGGLPWVTARKNPSNTRLGSCVRSPSTRVTFRSSVERRPALVHSVRRGALTSYHKRRRKDNVV